MMFESYFELLFLHRALLEAKFSELPNDPDVAASPQIAKISNQTVDEIIAILEKQGNKKEADSWREWRETLKSRPRELKIIKSNIDLMKANNSWASLSNNEKKDTIKDLAAPFFLNKDEIEKIIGTCENIIL
ncbi:hypothetical protein [Halomonas colorata]|uniref:hypothetical protein n=1 Tax=Halomonas colorata TaxID=2742615 RepID=UPI001867F401|nr:hypothetical protein [Halomonas colorata]